MRRVVAAAAVAVAVAGQFVVTRSGQVPPSGEPSYPDPGHQH
jgi:hypothetical protein